jgi:hypothetical protein
MSKNRKIGQALEKAEVLVGGILGDAGMMAELQVHGYSAERMAQLRSLVESFRTQAAEQERRYAEQYALREQLESARMKADRAATLARDLAKITFQNDTAATRALLLDQPKARALGEWLHQMRTFYTNLSATPAYLEQLASQGFTAERVQTESAQVEQVAALNIEQESKKGLAQSATRDRNETFNELAREIRKLEAVARHVFEARNDLLVRLGLVRRGGKASATEPEEDVWEDVQEEQEQELEELQPEEAATGTA